MLAGAPAGGTTVAAPKKNNNILNLGQSVVGGAQQTYTPPASTYKPPTFTPPTSTVPNVSAPNIPSNATTGTLKPFDPDTDPLVIAANQNSMLQSGLSASQLQNLIQSQIIQLGDPGISDAINSQLSQYGNQLGSNPYVNWFKSVDPATSDLANQNTKSGLSTIGQLNMFGPGGKYASDAMLAGLSGQGFAHSGQTGFETQYMGQQQAVAKNQAEQAVLDAISQAIGSAAGGNASLLSQIQQARLQAYNNWISNPLNYLTTQTQGGAGTGGGGSQFPGGPGSQSGAGNPGGPNNTVGGISNYNQLLDIAKQYGLDTTTPMNGGFPQGGGHVSPQISPSQTLNAFHQMNPYGGQYDASGAATGSYFGGGGGLLGSIQNNAQDNSGQYGGGLLGSIINNAPQIDQNQIAPEQSFQQDLSGQNQQANESFMNTPQGQQQLAQLLQSISAQSSGAGGVVKSKGKTKNYQAAKNAY